MPEASAQSHENGATVNGSGCGMAAAPVLRLRQDCARMPRPSRACVAGQPTSRLEFRIAAVIATVSMLTVTTLASSAIMLCL